MRIPTSFLTKSAVIFLFTCSAIPVFAQHGGGGHGGGGGGFHGGGGMHSSGGGGMRSNGGGFAGGRSNSPSAGRYGGGRPTASAPIRSGGGFVSRPSGNFSRPGNNFAGGNQRFGNSAGAPSAVADGGWHSFGGPGAGRASGAPAQGGNPGNAGGFHVLNGNRQPGSASSVRSFSGQGGEVWENAPSSRNVVPKSQSLSTLHNSFAGRSFVGRPGESPVLRSNSTLSASSNLGGRLAGGSHFTGNRSLSSDAMNRGTAVQQLRSSNGFGFNRGRGFGRGCWNCGFGFGRGRGFGFGWGVPWGFWGWDPFWIDPWWGWSAPGDGYYAAPNYNLYGYPDQGYYGSNNYSAPPPQQYGEDDQYSQDNSAPDGNWITPNGPSPSSVPNSGGLAVPVLIYMKNGSVLTVRDYWMIDGELHYMLVNGAQRAVNLEQVDLPRTNTENAKSGIKFIFKSEPSVTAPDQPDAEPGNPNAPSPTQQLNAVPQPQAHT
jgi:hypothetical protein